MSDVTQALVSLYPNCEWSIEDGMYENLTWNDTNTSKPTLEELTAKQEELIAAQPMKDLRQERNRRLAEVDWIFTCLLYTSPRPRGRTRSRMPSSA